LTEFIKKHQDLWYQNSIIRCIIEYIFIICLFYVINVATFFYKVSQTQTNLTSADFMNLFIQRQKEYMWHDSSMFNSRSMLTLNASVGFDSDRTDKSLFIYISNIKESKFYSCFVHLPWLPVVKSFFHSSYTHHISYVTWIHISVHTSYNNSI
jgi:hypothetical protein